MRVCLVFSKAGILFQLFHCIWCTVIPLSFSLCVLSSLFHLCIMPFVLSLVTFCLTFAHFILVNRSASMIRLRVEIQKSNYLSFFPYSGLHMHICILETSLFLKHGLVWGGVICVTSQINAVVIYERCGVHYVFIWVWYFILEHFVLLVEMAPKVGCSCL